MVSPYSRWTCRIGQALAPTCTTARPSPNPHLTLVPSLTFVCLCDVVFRGRPLGTLASRAVGFRIVLADGTLMEVVPPAFNTSKTNDDLFYSVRGGASGSWGVLTEISFNPYLVDELFSVFWVAGFLWDSDGAANMYRTYAELAKPIINDNRWTVSITVNGDAANPGSANQIFLEMAWVGPLAQAGDYDPSFFQSILDACTGCVQFLAIPNTIEPLSASLNYKFVSHPILLLVLCPLIRVR